MRLGEKRRLKIPGLKPQKSTRSDSPTRMSGLPPINLRGGADSLERAGVNVRVLCWWSDSASFAGARLYAPVGPGLGRGALFVLWLSSGRLRTGRFDLARIVVWLIGGSLFGRFLRSGAFSFGLLGRVTFLLSGWLRFMLFGGLAFLFSGRFDLLSGGFSFGRFSGRLRFVLFGGFTFLFSGGVTFLFSGRFGFTLLGRLSFRLLGGAGRVALVPPVADGRMIPWPALRQF